MKMCVSFKFIAYNEHIIFACLYYKARVMHAKVWLLAFVEDKASKVVRLVQEPHNLFLFISSVFLFL